MRMIYILIAVIVVALTLGCVGNKQDGASTKTQVTSAGTAPAVTSPTVTPVTTVSEDLFGTEGDIAAIDAMLNDASLDTSLSTSI